MPPRDCADLYCVGHNASGVYTVFVGGEPDQGVEVYCDMEKKCGGWLVCKQTFSLLVGIVLRSALQAFVVVVL